MDDEEYEASVRYNSQSVAYVLFMHLPSMSSTHCYCKHMYSRYYIMPYHNNVPSLLTFNEHNYTYCT